MKLIKEQELFQKIVQKAWDDTSFMQELIANPIKAIEKLTGKPSNFPKNKTLVVRDQTDSSTVYINIPKQKNMDDVELTEDQLEIVAGGGSIPPDLSDPPNLSEFI